MNLFLGDTTAQEEVTRGDYEKRWHAMSLELTTIGS
jgi:hypothetical protein